MQPPLVPPPASVTRETILATTKPGSLKRRIRLALYDLGIGTRPTGFPYVFWVNGREGEGRIFEIAFCKNGTGPGCGD